MNLKAILWVCLLACLMSTAVFSAVTGEIKGTVTNSQTGEPLSGVSVSVVGTTMGAKTNPDGVYIIINVPVGTYTLRFSSVGFSTLEVEDVHVSADLATFEDRQLEEVVTDLGKVITVRAERKLVVPDKTTSVNIVTADELRSLPVRGFEQAVSLQNSVVRMLINNDTNVRLRGQRETVASGGEINLRGGRPSEVAYYVDGFSQQDPLTGISSSNIANNAIQEIQVTSGAFSAEYGHVASGIVNVVTKSGTDDYHVNLDMVTDNIFGNSYDHNFYSMDFSGPLPKLEKAYFFVSGERRWLGDRSPSVKTEEFYEMFGVDTILNTEDIHRLPANALSGWSGQGKFDFEVTSNVKLSLNGNYSLDRWQEYQHNYLLNSAHSPRYRDENYGINGKITHNLNPTTYYNFSASYFMTKRVNGDGVVFDDLAAYYRVYDSTGVAYANPEWEDLNLFRDPSGPVTANNVGLTGDDTLFYADSYFDNYIQRHSSYFGVKGDFNKQIGIHHILKTGFDFQRHTLRYFENLQPTNTAKFEEQDINAYGFNDDGNPTDDLDYVNEAKHPINLGLYVEDRFDWKGLIISAGLRFDLLDYNALRIIDETYPLDPGRATGVDTLDRSDLEDSKIFTRVSPRLGISFPISIKTQLHINYGKFYQRPDLVRLYVGYDFMAARIPAGSYYPFPSPNLEPEKVTQYEAGITHQFGDNTALGITAYYKDVQDLTQIFHQTPAEPRVYDYFANTDYGTVKGIDLNLAMRRMHNIRMDLKYTLSWATGTGSYAQSQYNIAWQNPLEPPKTTAPLDYDQRHHISAVIDFQTREGEGPRIGEILPLENLSINSVVKIASGTPYTRMDVFDGATEAAVNPVPIDHINARRLPWIFNVDLKVERAFRVGEFDLTPYLWVQNLFDNENVAFVYEGSGRPDVTGWLSTESGLEFVDRTQDQNGEYLYRLKESNPKNYGPPRIIMLGLRASF